MKRHFLFYLVTDSTESHWMTGSPEMRLKSMICLEETSGYHMDNIFVEIQARQGR